MKIVNLSADRPNHGKSADFGLYKHVDSAPIANTPINVFNVDASGNKGTLLGQMTFKIWKVYEFTPPLSAIIRSRLEWFIAGYFEYHDKQKDGGTDHYIYFAWDQAAKTATVLISP